MVAVSGPLEPCEDCGNLKDTPQHVLGCDSSVVTPVEERIDHEAALRQIAEDFLTDKGDVGILARRVLSYLDGPVRQYREALAQNEVDARWIVGQWQRLKDEPVKEVAVAIVERCQAALALPATESAQPEEERRD